jgi:hypothetical protein
MKFLLGILLIFPFVLFAQEVPPEVSTVLAILAGFLPGWVEKYPILADILGIMATARLVIKPIMSALLTIFASTSFPFLAKVAEFSDNKIYKIIAFILDWVVSLKLPKKPKEPTV